MDDIQIAPQELKQKLDAGEKLLLVDVREPWENQTCAIEGAKLVPLNSIPSNLAAFEGADQIIVFCHHGGRSLNAAAFLRKQGKNGARSLTGGIDRWSVEIDPKVPRY